MDDNCHVEVPETRCRSAPQNLISQNRCSLYIHRPLKHLEGINTSQKFPFSRREFTASSHQASTKFNGRRHLRYPAIRTISHASFQSWSPPWAGALSTMGSHIHPWLHAASSEFPRLYPSFMHSCMSTTSVWFEVYHKDFVSSAALVLLVNLVEACPRSSYRKQCR